jgi:hypothetical protein
MVNVVVFLRLFHDNMFCILLFYGLDDVQRAAPATQYTTGIDWGAELLRITGSSDNKTVATPSQPVLCLSNEMKAIPSHSRPITRVRMKRMKNSDSHQESAPFKLQSKSSTRPSHAKPQACSVHPLVERLKCRQMWRRCVVSSVNLVCVMHHPYCFVCFSDGFSNQSVTPGAGRCAADSIEIPHLELLDVVSISSSTNGLRVVTNEWLRRTLCRARTHNLWTRKYIFK